MAGNWCFSWLRRVRTTYIQATFEPWVVIHVDAEVPVDDNGKLFNKPCRSVEVFAQWQKFRTNEIECLFRLTG